MVHDFYSELGLKIFRKCFYRKLIEEKIHEKIRVFIISIVIFSAKYHNIVWDTWDLIT